MPRRTAHCPLLALVLLVAGCGDGPSGPAPLSIFSCDAGASYTIGQTRNGALSASDCLDAAGHAFADYYQFTLPVAGPVAITVHSTTISGPLLATLFRPNRDVIEAEATSSRGSALVGGELAAGTYVLVVQGQQPGRIGDYTVTSSATRPPPFDCTAVTAYTIGATVPAALNASDCLDPNGFAVADYYEVTLPANSPIAITVRSNSGPSALLIALSGPGETVIHGGVVTSGGSNTIGGNLAAGTYVIMVASEETGQSATYTLSSAATLPPAFGCSVLTPHAIGTTTTGSLGGTDCLDPADFASADYYDVTVSSTGPVSITLTPTGTEEMIVALSNSREQLLVARLATHGAPGVVGGNLPAGRYILIIAAMEPGQTPEYSFTSSRTLPPPPPPPPAFLGCTASQPYTIGSTVTGVLADPDCVAVIGRFLDRYEFTLTETRTITFELQSSVFDTLLLLFNASGAVIANDDDSGDSTNSLLTITLQPGTYSIGASAYSDSGPYTLITR